jgi:hypothetical protein
VVIWPLPSLVWLPPTFLTTVTLGHAQDSGRRERGIGETGEKKQHPESWVAGSGPEKEKGRDSGYAGVMDGYDDGRVACDDQGIVIRHYYLFGAKRIGYVDIREARVSPLGLMGKWRIHGSGDLQHL